MGLASDYDSLEDEVGTGEVADKLIIGLDFGTTYSGIAYAFTGVDKPEVNCILDWPGLEGQAEPKVQTVMSYDPHDISQFTWGAQEHKGEEIIGVKLLLDPEQERPIFLPSGQTKAKIKSLPKPAHEVAADFIESIYKHALSRIEMKVIPGYLSMCKKEFVVSVPAVWSEKAKSLTLQAARAAGLHPVSLIKEPQAAALYTLFKTQRNALRVGEAFTVCDAGGGTVDLISYEIEEFTPQFKLKEIVQSSGGIAGSLVLNDRFAEAVRELVGDEKFFGMKNSPGFKKAYDEFDKVIKRAYRPDSEKTYFVSFPRARLEDDLDNGLEGNTWTMTAEDLRKIFAPLLSEVHRLVEEQVGKVRIKRLESETPRKDPVKAVFLVGGFGSSQCLREYLQRKMPDIKIVQPDDAWAAIVKGAVLEKIPVHAVVSSSIALKHLGIEAHSAIVTKEDERQKKIWYADLGEHRISKITWFIYQGEELKREGRIEHQFYRSLRANYTNKDLIWHSKLIQCEAPIAPEYPKKGVTMTRCTLKADLTQVDKSLFRPRKGANGKEYVDVNYTLVVDADPALLKFSLEFNGETCGTVEDVWS